LANRAVCNDAAFALIHAHCGIFRERVLAASDATSIRRYVRRDTARNDPVHHQPMTETASDAASTRSRKMPQ